MSNKMSNINQERTIERVNNLIAENKIKNIKAINVMEINHKPHTPVIGPKTINNSDGILDENCRCGRRGCNLTLDEHIGEVVLFLKLSKPIPKEEFQPILDDLQLILIEENIDGITFVQEISDCKFI